MEVECLTPGRLNRVQNVQIDVGGKGINVSKMIKSLGGTSLATGFVGGKSGKKLLKNIKKLELKQDFIEIVGETRTNIKVFDEEHGITELNEPGFILSKEDEQNICDKLVELADERAIFILSGSLPQGVKADFYQRLIVMLKEKRAKVFLDADGRAFRYGVEAKPNFVKPNLKELEQYFQISEINSLAEAKMFCEMLINDGIELVALSMGKDGAMFVTERDAFLAEGLEVNASSTVGAGDSMVGALAHAIEQKMPLEEAVKLSVAAATGAVMTEGTNPPTRELVEQLKHKVTLKSI